MKHPRQCRLRRRVALYLLALGLGAGAFGVGARAQGQPAARLAPDLLARLRGAGARDERVSVIVQLKEPAGRGLDPLLRGLGGRVTRRFSRLDAQAVSLPLRAAEALAARGDVRFVSPDRRVAAAGHVTTTTGAEAARVQTRAALLGLLTTTTYLDGTGVGIAVLDSGVDAAHESFQGGLLGLTRVAASQDFTGEGRTDDPYGHGTHVASLAAGRGPSSGGEYAGVAPNAKLINLRVLDSEGRGTVSGVLAALDWVLAHRALYNIRVVNLSLGTAAVESYQDDPVCQAVRRLVDAGIVVVAAAGNGGRDSLGHKIYGQVHSPGVEPAAITVGASNSFGTDARSDDAVTTYSSRGPTRGRRTDDDGVRHFDNLVKPDLVAPGNRLVGAAARGNRLLGEHPELNHDAGQPESRRMMYLSGSSMATPVVAGAAALLLQDNPRLTPNLVKAILMLTAQPLAGFNHFEQGAGLVNVEGAVRLGHVVRGDLSAETPLGSPLLTTAEAPAPETSLAGETFQWSQGLILNRTYATGPELLTLYQKVYGRGFVLGDGVAEWAGWQGVEASRMTGGVVLGSAILSTAGTTLDAGAFFLAADALLGGGTLLGDGVMVGDGFVTGDGVLVGDGVMVGDTQVAAQSARVRGDETPYMR